ncbi:MAG: F0F1 ATP synthase subunit A [Bacillota bacterium]|nr:F0F1 ATP synthase subunit A [Bacillota bacterium]
MGSSPTLFSINLFGLPVEITMDILAQWVIIAILSLFAIYSTSSLKNIPDRRQNRIEILVDTVNKLVTDNMGEEYKNFVPYIGTLMIFLLSMNLSGLFGVEPPTRDYSIALSLGLITFIVIQGHVIRKHGLLHYFLGYTNPYAVMMPLNIIERIMIPISLSLRLFGNMTAASVLVGLIYSGLGGLGLLSQLGIPIPFHFYFDIFDGTIQMIIFTMLTMINIKVISEH